ncbi:hypothetical protein MRX96_057227 [Rhipicephalus microplus]
MLVFVQYEIDSTTEVVATVEDFHPKKVADFDGSHIYGVWWSGNENVSGGYYKAKVFHMKVIRQNNTEFSSALSKIKIGDGRTLEQQKVQMFQGRFVSKDDAKRCCPHGVRLFYSNKEADAYNMRGAIEDVEDIYVTNADDTIVGYRSDAGCDSAKR